MKYLGTIDEWAKFDTKTYVTNKKFVRQKGVAFYNITKHDTDQLITYPIGFRPYDNADSENIHVTPLIYFGNQCPYMVKGKFRYTCGVVFYPTGSGGTFPLSDEMLNDPNWEKYEIEDYYKDLES